MTSLQPDSPASHFEPLYYKGASDDLIWLPPGIRYGILHAIHRGSNEYFGIEGLDSSNEPVELPVNVTGHYEGGTVFGLEDGEPLTSLKVSASAPWELWLLPFSRAPYLHAYGHGDRVSRLRFPPRAYRFTHHGEGAFIVSQRIVGSDDWDLLVNTVGAYDGTVPLKLSDSMLVIEADGDWTAEPR